MKTSFAIQQDSNLIGLSSMKEIRQKVEQKRIEDMFRFRTCCADPRASK